MSTARLRLSALLAVVTALLCTTMAQNASAARPAGGTPAKASDPAPSPAPTSPWTPGPAKIDLGHDLTLAVPAEHAFLPAADAAKMLAQMGNLHNDNLLGLVASKDDSAEWFVTIRYEAEGYIKDDEPIDATELLTAIREGTEESNKERVEKGFKALKIDGWSDAPKYDKTRHHLVWALLASDDEGQSVNFNTRILGRRGYVALNLVTSPERLAEYKPQAAALLTAAQFSSGARHEDFDEKKGDKVAEYGLAGLVLGGAGLAAAKIVKIGLIAKFSKVILAAIIAGKKVLLAALVAAGAAAKKIFGRKKLAPHSEVPPESGSV